MLVDIKIKEDTKELLNSARSKVLNDKPNLKPSNDNIIKYILKKFLGGKE